MLKCSPRSSSTTWATKKVSFWLASKRIQLSRRFMTIEEVRNTNTDSTVRESRSLSITVLELTYSRKCITQQVWPRRTREHCVLLLMRATTVTKYSHPLLRLPCLLDSGLSPTRYPALPDPPQSSSSALLTTHATNMLWCLLVSKCCRTTWTQLLDLSLRGTRSLRRDVYVYSFYLNN